MRSKGFQFANHRQVDKFFQFSIWLGLIFQPNFFDMKFQKSNWARNFNQIFTMNTTDLIGDHSVSYNQ